MKTFRLLVVLVAILAASVGFRVVVHRHTSQSISLHDLSAAAKVSPLARALRPNYPYSVIPGGAYSPAELRAAIGRDEHVREHYGDFDASKTRLVTLTADRFQYVSFRIKNKIFWTNKRLRIPRGELLLTDGRNYARTRCGNRLSSSKSDGAVVPPEGLSLPPLSAKELSTLPLASVPELALTLPTPPRLPFEAPRLEPELPASGSPIIAGPVSPVISGFGPPIFTTPSGGSAAGPFPPLTPRRPITPLIPMTPTPPPGPMDVPEPATGLCFFVLALATSGYGLFRLGTPRRRSKIDTAPR